jgi:hypothetical protein
VWVEVLIAVASGSCVATVNGVGVAALAIEDVRVATGALVGTGAG